LIIFTKEKHAWTAEDDLEKSGEPLLTFMEGFSEDRTLKLSRMNMGSQEKNGNRERSGRVWGCRDPTTLQKQHLQKEDTAGHF
jgi:hypothetical protein